MREGFPRSTLFVTLMFLIVSATATMGWSGVANPAHGPSATVDGSGHNLRMAGVMPNHRNRQNMPWTMAAGDGSACCACDNANPPALQSLADRCSTARVADKARFPRPLDIEPPQAPPRT